MDVALLGQLGQQPDPSAALWPAILGSAVPVAIWLWFFYRRDRYDPEPKRLLLGLFLLGALPVAFLAGVVNAVFAAVVGGFLTAAVVAPVGEEALKYLGFRLPTRRSRHFDEPVDGMIYGTTVGLGFAFAENVDYLISGYLGVDAFTGEALDFCTPGVECLTIISIARGLGPTLLHATASGVAGYHLSQRVLAGRRGAVRRGLLAAVGLHAVWNVSSGVVPFAFLVLIVVFVVLYLVLARRALAASPHRVAQLDDRRHGLEHLAHDGMLVACPGCSRPQRLVQRRCSVCGTPLAPRRAPAQVVCGHCGRLRPAVGRFCIWCGARADSGPTPLGGEDASAGPGR